MNADGSRELIIFTEVTALPTEEREAHLQCACAGNDILLRKVL